MNYPGQIAAILRKPFPFFETRWGYYKALLLLSAFITFFLFVFQPFGINTLESNTFLICLGFGAMTFLGAFIYEMVVHEVLKVRSRQNTWTFGKWILDTLALTLCISLANFLFSRLVVIGYIDWSLLPTMIYSTFVIGIIPVSALGAFLMMRSEKKYMGIAREINQSRPDHVYSQSRNKTIFNIPMQQIRYIEALQNYAKIGYINSEGLLKEQVERSTLKGITEKIADTAIVKCHRSYLVNRDHITEVMGNAQGLQLTLADCEKSVPVSRAFVPVFRN